MEAQIEAQLPHAVHVASQRPDVLAAVHRIYAALQGRIDSRRPICVASGKCCHFERYGHRLYVSTMELAAFVAAGREAGGPDAGGSGGNPAASPRRGAEGGMPDTKGWDGTGCPFQIGKLCGVHGYRPFGCRVFFCDPTATEWQREQYEEFHGEMRKLHEELGVPYFYLEWRAAVRAVGLAAQSRGL